MHYHLFPKDVAGLGYDKKNPTYAIAWGNRPTSMTDSEPNSKGEYWWPGASGIYIMRTAKWRRCDECNAEIGCQTRPGRGRIVKGQYGGSWHASTQMYVQRDWYVGIADSCFLYYWGVDYHMCLNCARKLLGKYFVYKCDVNRGDGIGYYPDPPPDWVMMKDRARLLISDLLPAKSWTILGVR